MYVKALVILFLLSGLLAGLWKLYDAGGDAREDKVRLEWAQEKLNLVEQRDAAEKRAAENRKEAEAEKKGNTKRGEKVIEQTRNLDPDWSATRLPAGMYETLRQN
jgi:hypothetical protein